MCVCEGETMKYSQSQIHSPASLKRSFPLIYIYLYTSTPSRERKPEMPPWSLRKEGTAYAKRRMESASWLILNRIGILLLIRDTRLIGEGGVSLDGSGWGRAERGVGVGVVV